MSRPDRHAPVRTLILAASVALAACGGRPATSAAPATPVPSGVTAVQATDGYRFSPSTITVPGGSVTFSVTNVDDEAHEFEIFQGETVVGGIEGLAPGLTKDLTVTLQPGAYTFKCLLNGHDQLGMTGTLTVS